MDMKYPIYIDKKARCFLTLKRVLISSLLKYDSIFDFTFTDVEYREAVTAAINTRELTKSLVRVKSSNLWSYGLNIRDRKDKKGDLLIQFKGKDGGPGDVYIYYDVPIMVYRKMVTATSKGHYFWVNIRNRFTYAKLTGDKRTHLPNGI